MASTPEAPSGEQSCAELKNENSRLRKKLADTRMKGKLRKKAAAYFAKESMPDADIAGAEVRVSMSRKGNYYDDASTESLDPGIHRGILQPGASPLDSIGHSCMSWTQ